MFVSQLRRTLRRFNPSYREFRQFHTPNRTLIGASMGDVLGMVKRRGETVKSFFISVLMIIRVPWR